MLFFAATFLATWAFWIPSALLFGEGVAEDPFSVPGFVVLQTVGAAVPSLVAYWVLTRTGGRKAVTPILERYKLWRVGVRWYVAALFLVPVIHVTGVVAGGLLGGGPLVDPSSPLDEMLTDMGLIGTVFVFPLTVLGQLPTSPLLEEFGWRGFALPHLQDRYPALISSLILGFLWGLWHLPLTLAYGDALGPYLVRIVSVTILMTWVFNHTGGSMVVAMLFHASLNASLVPLSSESGFWPGLVLTVIVAAVVIVLKGGRDLADRSRVQWSDLEVKYSSA